VPVHRENPYANFNFVVDIGAGESLAFSEVDLPAGAIEVIEYREGGDKASTRRKLPGLTTYPNVTLRRGLTGRLELFQWWDAVRSGAVDRRNVSIVVHDEQHNPVQSWVLRNAWPAKLDWSALDAKGNEVVIETLELAHEGFETE
jgi:phage tail-like protein